MLSNCMIMIVKMIFFLWCWLLDTIVVLVWIFTIHMWQKSQMDSCFWCSLWKSIVECRRLRRTEQNIKDYILKSKHDILTVRIENMIGEMKLLTTDIIHAINKTWEKSFFEVEYNKKSKSEFRWFPYNQNCLLHKQLQDTITMKDIETEKNMHWCDTFHKINIFHIIN